jgi:hypothetical protein
LTEILDTGFASKPQTNGEAPLPKRAGPKGLLPGSWVGRTLRVAYVDCYGGGQEATAALLDLYPFGPVVNLSGERTALSWDCLRTVTLLSD